MAGPSDHRLVAEIRSGRRDALGILFDRYSPPLYEFLYYQSGDRDQAARLLEEVVARVPRDLEGLSGNESVRGWLYGLARETALGYLRQKGWLEALPPANEPPPGGFPEEIWLPVRTMPAFHRAVLILEELHGLSPTEKSRALNVARTDLPRLIEEARHAFELQYDILARRKGRPLSAEIDAERQWGIHRRHGVEGSLFGYLPIIPLPASLASAVRARALAALPLASFPGENDSAFTPAPSERPRVQGYPVPPPPPPPPAPSPFSPAPLPRRSLREMVPEGCTLRVVIGALAIAAVITALAACGFFLWTRDSAAPTITRIEPADKASIPAAMATNLTHVIVNAAYQDNRAVDVTSVRLVLDGRDVTALSLITDSELTYPADLAAGTHTVLLELRDTAGNKASRSWQFAVLPRPEATRLPTPVGTPGIIPIPLPTPGGGLGPVPTAGLGRTPTPLATVTPQSPPIINSFTASQTAIKAGVSTLLTWSVSGADLVFLNQDKVDPTGTRLVTPATTTTYHLIANSAGGTVDQTLVVTVESPPDLTVSEIGVTVAGQITYAIRNIGTGDVTQMFLIQVYVDGAPVDSNRRVSSLPAGQTVSLYVPNYTVIGTHAITVRVNGQQEVQESNWNNNELTRTVTGPTPTPTVTTTATPTITPTPTNTLTPTPTNTSTNTPTATPSITPTPITYLVTSAVTTLNSTTPYTGTCPGNFNFSGTISTNGPTNVTYRWERSDSTTVGPFSLPFSSAGTQSVTDAWTNAPVNVPANPNSWERLHVLTPNDFVANQAIFANNCY